jgi:hypothetical protein
MDKTPATIQIGWREIYDGPLVEAVTSRLGKEKAGGLGFVEIPIGFSREALYRKRSVYEHGRWMDRWSLEFIRQDDDVLTLFPLHAHPDMVLSALRRTAAFKDQLALF